MSYHIVNARIVNEGDVIEVDLEALKTELDRAGAPWTAGRPIPTIPGLEGAAAEAGAREAGEEN